MSNISLILITKNESERLIKWANWLPKLTKINELVVVDDNSTDNTPEIVKKLSSKNLKVKTFSRGLANNFSAQRQFAVSKTSNDRILWLDADEQPSNSLVAYINNIDIDQYDYAFKRSDFFLGHKLKYGETSSQYFLRLFNKKYGKFVGSVHEIWSSQLPTQNIDIEIIHQSHPTLKSYFQKINLYSDIRSQELFKNGTRTNLFQIIFYPTAKFIQNYFFRLGFLDGTPGIIFALGMSFHSFLVRSKLWTLQNP